MKNNPPTDAQAAAGPVPPKKAAPVLFTGAFL
jgi:hypothetical protein